MVSLPTFVPKVKYFGLSVGRVSLRAVELDASGRPRAMAEVVFPDEIFSGGVLVKKDVFVATLKQLIAAGKLSTSFVAVCIPESYTFTRGYRLPVIPLTEVHEAIAWHAKDLFPFPPEEIYFDWKLLEQKENEYEVAVVAVQKNVLDLLIEALISAGLKPLRVEPGASAISRLLVLKPNEHALMTEVNRRGAYVTLVEGEKTIFTTVINYAKGDTVETYVRNINKTLTEISAFYRNKGVLKDDKVQVIFSGELATEDWLKLITPLVKNPVKILKTQVQNPAFNKAYAAAAAAIAPPMDPHSVNLLPTSLQERYDRESTAAFNKAVMGRAALATGIIFAISALIFLSLRLTRLQLDAQVRTITEQVKLQTAETQKLLLLNAKAKNIVALAPLRLTQRQRLIEISQLLPEGMVINQWEYDDNKLQYTIVGVAPTRDALLEFKTNLEQTENFTKVSLPLGSLETAENVRFSLSFILKR